MEVVLTIVLAILGSTAFHSGSCMPQQEVVEAGQP